MNKKEDVQELADALADIAVVPFPAIGIDVDASLDAQMIFIRALALNWPGRIVAFSNKKKQVAKVALDRLKLRCDDLILAETPEAKVEAITRTGVVAMISHDYVILSQLPADRTRLLII